MTRLEYAIKMRALLGDISECGDYGVVKVVEEQCVAVLLDVLGHGIEAHRVANQAAEYLEKHWQLEPIELVLGLHEQLGGTRGAVMAVCRLDFETGMLEHVGIGNIVVRTFGTSPGRLLSRDGIVGYGGIWPMMKKTMLKPGDVLLMHSDGIQEHFDAVECAGLMKEEAEAIATGILERFGTKQDDASCIVLKY